MTKTEIITILNQHHKRHYTKGGKLYAAGIYTTRSDSRSHYCFTDVTNYSRRKLYDYLGY